MVAVIEGRGLKIVEWEREHYVAGLQRQKELAAHRQQRHREKQKRLPPHSPDQAAPPAPAGDPFAGCAPELVAKWRPAFDALATTGKLPALCGEHLARLDREYPRAKLAENIVEVVEEVRGVAGTIGDTMKWLRKAVSALERRQEQRAAAKPPSNADKF